MIRFVVLFRSRKKADEDRDRLKKKLKNRRWKREHDSHSSGYGCCQDVVFLWCPHPPTGHNPIYGTEPHIRVIRPLDALKYTQTIRQAVTLSQGYQKATMGRMSNLICLKHVKINNQQRNIILERRSVGMK